MAKDERNTYTIQNEASLGEVKIADEVVAIIAALAATEVEGVASMAGNITNEGDRETWDQEPFKRCKSRCTGRRGDSIPCTEHQIQLQYCRRDRKSSGESEERSGKYDRT